MSQKYLNFDLQVTRAGAGFRASVVASPAGEASTAFEAPFSPLELENLRLKITRNRRAVRGQATPADDTARAFGERLFNAVFAGDVQSRLRSSLDEAARQGAGLRLRVKDSPDLSDMPWEYLYSPELDRFLSLSSETPIVRYVATPYVVPALDLVPPLRLLIVVADPTDFERLNVDREIANLKEAVSDLERRGLLTTDRVENGSFSSLQRQLRRGEYHIVHFVGHGQYEAQTKDGTLVFEDQGGRGRAISGREIGTLLHDHRSLRLVVLNACEGGRASGADPFAGVAQSLVRQRIPAVIAMQYEISDAAAVTFSREFYGALADGVSLDAALGESRKAMFAEGSGPEWGTPVLYTLSSDGRVFDLRWSPGARPVAPAAAPPLSPPAPAPAVDVRPITIAPRIESAADAPAVASSRWPGWVGPSLLLAAVFVTNMVETWADSHLRTALSPRALSQATAMRSIEQGLTFQNHDMTNPIAIYAYSLAYFVVFPLLALSVAFALARRPAREPYRVLVLALTVDYIISLAFFLLVPVPERWAFPESGAILLSDLWTSNLIEAFRPMSALDNCFPSFHVSMMVIIVITCYLYDVKLRSVVAALGGIVILSTFVLGIHWIPDMVAGVAVAVISVCVARRASAYRRSRQLARV